MTPEHDREPSTVIGWRTATILYLSLVVAAFTTLKGKALGVALVIVVGLAAKSYLHYWKERSGG